MRRIPFAASNILLTGMLLLPVAAQLYGEEIVVGGQNLPDTFTIPNQAKLNQLNELYRAEKIDYPEYEANFNQLEKSMDTGGSPMDPFSLIILESGVPTNIGTSQITANWAIEGNHPGTHYLVEISADPGFSSVQHMITTNLSATFTGLSAGTPYYMRVQVVSDYGESPVFMALPSATTLNSSLTTGAALIGVTDRGTYQGNHYFEIYWALPAGQTCLKNNQPVGSLPENVFLSASSKPIVQTSWAGASGYSNNVCQTNVRAPAGSGPETLNFIYNTYANCPASGCYVGSITSNGAATPGVLDLTF